MWTKKYDDFAVEHGLRPSSTLLWRWIMRRAKKSEVCEIEVDINKFNREIEKKRSRGGYSRRALRFAINQLDEQTNGAICILKEYGKGVYKILVRPLFLVETKDPKTEQKSQNSNVKPMYTEEQKLSISKQQQQKISKLEDVLEKTKLKFDPDAIKRIWKLAGKKIDNVVDAITLLLHRNKIKQISNPQGFLIDCLKFKWHEGFDPYYVPELPVFTTNQDLIQFSNFLRKDSLTN